VPTLLEIHTKIHRTNSATSKHCWKR